MTCHDTSTTLTHHNLASMREDTGETHRHSTHSGTLRHTPAPDAGAGSTPLETSLMKAITSTLAVAAVVAAALVTTPGVALAAAPTVSGVTITGPAIPKTGIQVNYTYTDADGNPESGTTYRWLSSSAQNGTYSPLTGVLTRNIVLPASYANTWLKAEVTPRDSTGAAGAPVLSAPIQVAPFSGNANTNMLTGNYGISHHFLHDYINTVAANQAERIQSGETWEQFLSTFNVAAYVQDVRDSGASWILLTMGQNDGYMLGPNTTYDTIAGVAAGTRTPRTRDLPAEIADALAVYGIKTMLYIPANPPNSADRNGTDCAITIAFGYTCGQDGVPSQDTMAKWQSVIREYSERYAGKVAGWWMDGMFPSVQPAYTDFTKPGNYASLASALKAGNPNRIIAFNSGLGSNNHQNQSVYEDYTPGESNNLGSLPSNGRWADQSQGQQWFDWTYLGSSWGRGGTGKNTNSLTSWVNQATDLGGAVNLDTKVNRFGRLDPAQLGQLRQVNEVVHGAGVTGTTVDDANPAIMYTGSFSSVDPGGCHAGTCHNANTAGSTVQYTFTGTGITWNGIKGPDQGSASVSIDDGPATTVNLVAPTRSVDVAVYASPALSNGTHTIKITTQNSGWVTVDRFRVTSIPSGYRKVTIAGTDDVLDVSGARDDNDTPVIRWDSNNGLNQRFEFRPLGDGYVRIVNQDNGKDVVVQGASPNPGAKVIQYSYEANANANDEWLVENAGSGYVRIRNRLSGLYLTAGPNRGDQFEQRPLDGTGNQKFSIT